VDKADNGTYNNYHCKKCGKKWVELVTHGGCSAQDFNSKEIEDYHKGYVKEPKLRCPLCDSASLVIVNEDKKTHHYEVHCMNIYCQWKSKKYEHSWGYLKEKENSDGIEKQL
jgi:hypothetical protein